jgi:CheY-like chemotaxis protein
VLVVDDVAANLLAIETQLQGLGCEIQSAASGEAALSLMLRESFAAMLLDVKMPGIDGYEVARYVRMNSDTRELPIIFLTAAVRDEAEVRRGYDCGAVDFLLKPIHGEILRSKIRVFVELYASRRELTAVNARLQNSNAKLLALADAEAATADALRQVNQELAMAQRELRLTQVQLPLSALERGRRLRQDRRLRSTYDQTFSSQRSALLGARELPRFSRIRSRD